MKAPEWFIGGARAFPAFIVPMLMALRTWTYDSALSIEIAVAIVSLLAYYATWKLFWTLTKREGSLQA